MTSNPMQRKARNSFLLGMTITLVICLIIGVSIFMVISSKNKSQEEERGMEIIAYVLNTDVKSGQAITPDLLTPITVYQNMVPVNYINSSSISTMQSQDKDGNILQTNSQGVLYINQENNQDYVSVSNNSNDKNKVLIENEGSRYYRIRRDNNTREYIEFEQVPVVAKVDMYKNTILTSDVVTKSDEIITNDVRYIEYNMLILPTTVELGDYIDIRITLPNGQDLIVISKKEIKSLLGDTIGLELTEGEILLMNSAIVESYIMTASKLYAIQYVEAGIQDSAEITYTPTDEVRGLIGRNPNILQEAKEALSSRFNDDIRIWTNNELNVYSENKQTNIESGLQEEIDNARKAREAYLSGLTSY